ncbi:MAG: radical SAM protein [Elusimicrobiota bacterium]
MILKLIIPKRKNADEEPENWGGQFQSIIFGVKKYSSVMLSIPVIAGLTPKGIDIVIKDENIENINFDEKVDFVGITANTSLVERAYEISDEFRKKGVKVIIGGIHVSMLPEEGLQHADSVLVGEAENIWAQVIDDFQNNNLKRIYKSDQKPNIDIQPMPRYDLVNNQKYSFHVIQATRGCPFDCEFCSVQAYLGNKYRCKSVENVIKEIEYLNSIEKKLIFFCDDNFVANIVRTKEILRRMIPLRTPYTIQTTIDIYKDDELLDLLVSSGCLSVLIGFETIDQQNLDNINKHNKVETYYKAIEKIQSKGLIILGSFVFGFDNDSVNIFRETVNFVKNTGLGNCVVNILTPLPGTALSNRLLKERRILDKNWYDYDCCHVCFEPKNMTQSELKYGYYWAFKELFELNNIWDRIMRLYALWNKNGARLHERMFPIITNMASHYVSNTIPKSIDPFIKGDISV